MGNIFAPATPQPQPQRTVEYHVPERRVPEYRVPGEYHSIAPRSRQPEYAPVRTRSTCIHYTRETCLRGRDCPLVHEGNVHVAAREPQQTRNLQPRPNLQPQPQVNLRPQPNLQPRPNVQPQVDLPPPPNFQRPRYDWILDEQPNLQPQAELQPRPNLQSRRPCRYFALGHCKKGTACNFSHDKNTTTGNENQGATTV